MADRTLVKVTERADHLASRWVLRIERSAAGPPGGLVIIERQDASGLFLDDLCVVVDDLRVLQPAIDWAEGR